MTRSNTEILQTWGYLSTWHLCPASNATGRKVVGGEWERTKSGKNHVENFLFCWGTCHPYRNFCRSLSGWTKRLRYQRDWETEKQERLRAPGIAKIWTEGGNSTSYCHFSSFLGGCLEGGPFWSTFVAHVWKSIEIHGFSLESIGIHWFYWFSMDFEHLVKKWTFGNSRTGGNREKIFGSAKGLSYW